MSGPISGVARPSRLLGLALGAALLASVVPLAGVAAASATHFSVVPDTVSTVAGTGFHITVTALDGSGSTDTNYAGTVHFTSSDGQPILPPDSTLTNGVGTFAVTLKTVGTQTIVATDMVTPSITGSASVGVTPAAAARLSFTQSPSNARYASVFPIQPVVKAYDSYGNLATAASDPGIALTIKSGTPASGGGTLTGCAYTWSLGIATFSGCQISAAGIGYQLHATAGSMTADSGAFTVWGVGASLVFTQQPGTSNATVAFPTQPQVTMRDALGSVVADFNGAVSLGIRPGTGTSGASLSCTLQMAVNGIATFSNCSINLAGSNYQLAASTTLPALSGFYNTTPFNVLGAPAKLAFFWGNTTNTTAPTTSTGGTAFPTQPVIVEQDSVGNTITTDNATVVNLAITAAGTAATLTCASGTSMHLTNGVATFYGCAINKVGTYH